MKKIVFAIAALLVIGGGGAAIYYTQFGGRDQTALAAVRKFFNDHGVGYETLGIDGGEIVGTALAWTAGDGTRVTAERLVLDDLDAVAAAGVAVASNARPQLLGYGRVEGVTVSRPRTMVPVRVDSLTVEAFSARRLLNFFGEIRNPDVSPIRKAERLLNDVVDLGEVLIEGVSFDAGEAGGPVVTLERALVTDLGDGGVGELSLEGFAADAGPLRIAALRRFEILGLEAADALTAFVTASESEAASAVPADAQTLLKQFDIFAEGFATFELKRLAVMDFMADPTAVGQSGAKVEVGEYAINEIAEGELGAFLVRDVRFDAPPEGAIPPLQGGLDRLTLENYDLSPLKIVIEQVIAAGEDPQGRLPDPEAFENANVALQLGASTRVDNLFVSAFGSILRVDTPRPGTLTGSTARYRSDGAWRIDARPLNPLPAPPPLKALLAAREIDTLTFDVESTAEIDAEERDMALDQLSFELKGLGGLRLVGQFGDLGRATRLDPSPDNPYGPLLEVYGAMTVKDATLTITDTGLSDLIFDVQALQTDADPAELRAGAAVLAQGFLPGAIAAPWVAFLNEGGVFTLRVNPPEPTKMLDFAPAMADPAAFGIRAEHTPD